jgi:predicted O-linked N-acetylglucosamine transferase (SPINDLY family)
MKVFINRVTGERFETVTDPDTTGDWILLRTDRTFTKEGILFLIERDDTQAMRALVTVYHLQTDDEKEAGRTTYQNGAGFNGVDSEFLSSLARYAIEHNRLSPKQLEHVRKRLPKYIKQLLALANYK